MDEPAEVGRLAEIVTPKGTIRTLPSHLPAANPRLSGLDGFFVGRCRNGSYRLDSLWHNMP
jgi:16S rRNA (cytosine967-C5)-methyltransferase